MATSSGVSPFFVQGGERRASLHEKLDDFERRVSRARFMERCVVAIIGHVDPGTSIDEPGRSDDIVLVSERVQQRATAESFIDVDSGFEAEVRDLIIAAAVSLEMPQVR
jgi:hypothetical protein